MEFTFLLEKDFDWVSKQFVCLSVAFLLYSDFGIVKAFGIKKLGLKKLEFKSTNFSMMRL